MNSRDNMVQIICNDVRCQIRAIGIDSLHRLDSVTGDTEYYISMPIYGSPDEVALTAYNKIAHNFVRNSVQ